jgi:small subunit ribosomal protein S1
VVKVGEKIDVKILRVDTDDRKIGLSRKRVEWAEEDQGEPVAEGAAPAAPREKKAPKELKGGLGGSGPLIAPPTGDKA